MTSSWVYIVLGGCKLSCKETKSSPHQSPPKFPSKSSFNHHISLELVHTRSGILPILLEDLLDRNMSILAILGLFRPLSASVILPILLSVQSRSKKYTTKQFNELKSREFIDGLLRMAFLMKSLRCSSSLTSRNGLVTTWFNSEHLQKHVRIKIFLKHEGVRVYYLEQTYEKQVISCKRIIYKWRPKVCIGLELPGISASNCTGNHFNVRCGRPVTMESITALKGHLPPVTKKARYKWAQDVYAKYPKPQH